MKNKKKIKNKIKRDTYMLGIAGERESNTLELEHFQGTTGANKSLMPLRMLIGLFGRGAR